jgi:phage recombination protein Bet
MIPAGPSGIGPGLSLGNIVRVSDITPETPLMILTPEGGLHMSVRDVLTWVAPQAPPGEALKFLMTCQVAQVNPFMGEAHLVDHGGRWTTIIDKSGWLKRAQAHPAYAGHQAGIICQEFDPKTNVRGQIKEVEGAFLPPGCIVIGGWAKVLRKDRQVPTVGRVSMTEYNRGSATWKTIPCTMIRKVALVQALRESGLISSGWYDPAEGPASYDVATPPPAESMPALEVAYAEVEDATIKPDTLATLLDLVARARMTDAQLLAALHKRGVSRTAELTDVQANELILKLEPIVDRLEQAANPDAFLMPDAPRRPGPEQSTPASPAPTVETVEADEPANLLSLEHADANADATFDPMAIEAETVVAQP